MGVHALRELGQPELCTSSGSGPTIRGEGGLGGEGGPTIRGEGGLVIRGGGGPVIRGEGGPAIRGPTTSDHEWVDEP